MPSDKTKAAAFQDFMESFGLPAYAATAVDDGAEMPYITYTWAEGAWGDGPVAVQADIWYRTESEAEPNAKVAELSKRLGLGGVCLRHTGCRRLGELDGGDVVARALARRDIPLGQKLVVGRLYGDLADIQMAGQRALRRQAFAAGESAAENIGLDGAVELLIQRRSGLAGERIG